MGRFRSLAFAFTLILSALGAACGGSTAETPPAEAPPPPKPKNAIEIARSIAGARVGAMLWADRFHGKPLEKRLVALNPMRAEMVAVGIDPTKDLVAAYVASTGVTTSDVVVAIVEHKLDEQRVQAGLDMLVQKSDPPGAWLENTKVPMARVTVRGQTRVIAMVEPSFLAIVPEALATQATRFVGTGGFPDPEGPYAIVATVEEPSRSLAAAQAPRVPETVRSGRATFRFGDEGGVDISSTGESTDPVQAGQDAQALTSAIDAKTSISLGFLKVRLFSPIIFRSEGSQVKSDTHLTDAEVDRLLTLAETFLPR